MSGPFGALGGGRRLWARGGVGEQALPKQGSSRGIVFHWGSELPVGVLRVAEGAVVEPASGHGNAVSDPKTASSLCPISGSINSSTARMLTVVERLWPINGAFGCWPGRRGESVRRQTDCTGRRRGLQKAARRARKEGIRPAAKGRANTARAGGGYEGQAGGPGGNRRAHHFPQ